MKFTLGILSLILLASCSSKKNNSASTEAALGASKEDSLELSGSSDDRRAGGLRTVNFDFHSDRLTTDARKVLDADSDFLEKNPKVSVEIEGHCDERGSSQYNLALGERRAKVVRDYLRAKGIKTSRMTIISYGKERPLEEGGAESARARNRRGAFVITGL